ncbi:amidohydrolase family protein [Nonomuraea sp. NPDC046802]|uniref:amidohydrolase family protein n=1 Tax=Nonomuraea sp. NPDC046802 TaxID=3154919 RepID=UPI0033EAD35C
MNTPIDAVRARAALTDLDIVDAHAHAGPFSLFFIPDPDPASMVEVMDRCGVSLALISAHLGVQLDTTAGNEATAAAVSRHPDRFLGYLVVNPWQDPIAELERWEGDQRFRGMKIHPDQHAYPLTGPRYNAVWDFARTTGVPVLTHTWAASAYNDLPMLGDVADRHPDVDIIAGHAGGMPSGYDAAIAVAARFPNVTLEICSSRGHGDYVRRMVDEVGSGQVAFGSDFPFLDLRVSLGRVLFASLASDDLAAVLGGTMRKLLSKTRS